MRELLVVFDAGTRYKNTSLNENLQKGPDLRNNVVCCMDLITPQKREMLRDGGY